MKQHLANRLALCGMCFLLIVTSYVGVQATKIHTSLQAFIRRQELPMQELKSIIMNGEGQSATITTPEIAGDTPTTHVARHIAKCITWRDS